MGRPFVVTEPKRCETCGRWFVREPGTAVVVWARRRFCSRPCRRGPRKPAAELRSPYRQARRGGVQRNEHRRIMEGLLGRKLGRFEFVHHRNGIKTDNRPENLELVTPAEHGQRHTWRSVELDCAVCGKRFTPHKTKRARQKTCSERCRRILQGRTRVASKTHCPQGHPLSGDNLFPSDVVRGERRCRICHNARHATAKRAKRG